MDNEQRISRNNILENSRRGEVIAADTRGIPEGLSHYIESEVLNGNNVFIDTHGNVTTRQAYDIPEFPAVSRDSEPTTRTMVEGAVIDVR